MAMVRGNLSPSYHARVLYACIDDDDRTFAPIDADARIDLTLFKSYLDQSFGQVIVPYLTCLFLSVQVVD